MSSTETLEKNTGVNEEWYVPKHKGARYYSVLLGIHQYLRPNGYLEVGIRSGDSLALASCPTIGIDPRFIHPLNSKLNDDKGELKKQFHLFETTSDRFFEKENPLEILNLSHIDFLFLDGAHICDYLLRDLINSEKIASKNSIIALHDCVPIDVAMTLSRQERESSPYPVVYKHYWAGDCWRVMVILKKYRPELKMHVMDAHPTGLVLLSNLDPSNTVLKDNYDKIIEEMKALNLASIGLRNYISSLNVQPTSEYIGSNNLAKHYSPWHGANDQPMEIKKLPKS